jgi:uncharacterized membrane protein
MESTGPAMQNTTIVSHRFTMTTIAKVLGIGRERFSNSRTVSVSYSLIFAVIGLLILAGIEQAHVAPMMLPLAGGFMLLGPILLCGFFALADRLEAKLPATFADVLAGFRHATREILALATVCMLLFLIWVTDAATLYGFMVGRTPVPLLGFLPPPDNVWSFVFWSSLMGSALAFVIFAISAFSVPLLYYRRAGLVQAVVLSVRTVFANFLPCILWALLLAVALMSSILLLPLFPVVFPVLSFASHALYREIFPRQAV